MRLPKKPKASSGASHAEKVKKKFNADMRMIRSALNADPPKTAQQIEDDIGRWGWKYGLKKADVLIVLLHVESRCSSQLDQSGKEYLRSEIDRLFNSQYDV